MSPAQLRIDRTSDSWTYDVRLLQVVDARQSREAPSIAPPGMPARSNIILTVGGQQNEHVIQFEPIDDGTDRSNGTLAANVTASDYDDLPYDGSVFSDDTVVSLTEQRLWLHDFVDREAFDASWTIDDLDGDEFNGDDIVIDSVDTRAYSRARPRAPAWQVGFRFGETI